MNSLRKNMHHFGIRHLLVLAKRIFSINLQQFQSIFLKHLYRVVPTVAATLPQQFVNTLNHVTATCTLPTQPKNPVQTFTKFIIQPRPVERRAQLNTLQADTKKER